MHCHNASLLVQIPSLEIHRVLVVVLHSIVRREDLRLSKPLDRELECLLWMVHDAVWHSVNTNVST